MIRYVFNTTLHEIHMGTLWQRCSYSIWWLHDCNCRFKKSGASATLYKAFSWHHCGGKKLWYNILGIETKADNTLETEASWGATWQPLLNYCKWPNKLSHMPQRLLQSEPSVVGRSNWGKPEEFLSLCTLWMEHAAPRRNWKTIFSTRGAEDATPCLSLPLPLVYSRPVLPDDNGRNPFFQKLKIRINPYAHKSV